MRGLSFLEVAEMLGQHPGEAWHRTRIGRLYYGVYLEYRQFCIERMGFIPRKFASEHRVVNDLIRARDQNLGNLLRELREARNQADYDLETPPDEIARLLATSVMLASTLMIRLDTLLNERS